MADFVSTERSLAQLVHFPVILSSNLNNIKNESAIRIKGVNAKMEVKIKRFLLKWNIVFHWIFILWTACRFALTGNPYFQFGYGHQLNCLALIIPASVNLVMMYRLKANSINSE